MVKIEGYKVKSTRDGSDLWWQVLDARGTIVGSVSICVSTYNTAFCKNQTSSVVVEARGPKFFDAVERMANEGVPLRDIPLKAQAEAEKAGQLFSVRFGGTGCSETKAKQVSRGRKIARDKAWPWLIAVLGVPK